MPRAELPEAAVASAEVAVLTIWERWHLWEIARQTRDLAGEVAPGTALRSLDALHLATYLLVRRLPGDVRRLTADARLRETADARPLLAADARPRLAADARLREATAVLA